MPAVGSRLAAPTPLPAPPSPPVCAESPLPAERLCWLQRSSCGPVAAYCLLNWMTEWRRKGTSVRTIVKRQQQGRVTKRGLTPPSRGCCLATLTICAFIHSFSARCHCHFIMFIISCWSVNWSRPLSGGHGGGGGVATKQCVNCQQTCSAV